METKTLTLPTVHLNGTSREALLDDYLEAAQALYKAIQVIQAAGPHGRDYYPLGNLGAAQEEHRERIEQLQGVHKELSAIVDYLLRIPGQPSAH